MHIPRTGTTDIEVLTFSEALSAYKNAEVTYDKSKWLYVPHTYDEYRYILGTKGKDPIICVGINPSTAAPDDLDPTLKSAERIAKANGYDSFLMFNVYAQRATNPDDMEKEYNSFMHKENLCAFEYLLSLFDGSPKIWAAWGAIIEKRDYLSECVTDMLNIAEKYGAEWYHAGPLSKKGHPHHPLYLKSDTPLELFDIDAYISKKSELAIR